MELAADLVRQDREINRLNREIFRMAIEVGEDPDTREWAMLMILVARALERVGDNAVDIGEQVAFVVTGLFREFSDSSHPLGLGGASDGSTVAHPPGCRESRATTRQLARPSKAGPFRTALFASTPVNIL